MSGFSVRKDGMGWYAVGGPDEVDDDHYFSDVAPDQNAWLVFKDKARGELERSARTVERIIEGVALGTCSLDAPDVVAFMKARKARRDILSQATGDPNIPLPDLIYPSGT